MIHRFTNRFYLQENWVWTDYEPDSVKIIRLREDHPNQIPTGTLGQDPSLYFPSGNRRGPFVKEGGIYLCTLFFSKKRKKKNFFLQ